MNSNVVGEVPLDIFGVDGESFIVVLEDGTERIDIPQTVDYAKVVIGILICIFGLLGNFIALFLILVLREYKKSVTHWYVLQLAIADTIFLLSLPFKVSEDINLSWIYPNWMCKGKETILFLNYYASIFFLMTMTLDRYIAVCHVISDKLQKFRKQSVAFGITVVTWILAFSLSIPVLLFSFKVGTEPYCLCSYEFPQYDGEIAQCLEQGLHTNNASGACVTITAGKTAEELYCKPNLYQFRGLGDFTAEAINALNSANATLPDAENNFAIPPSLLLPIEKEESNILVSAACTYWDRPVGWTAFLALNFSLFFLVPLFVMIACYGLILRRLSETRVRTSSQTNVSFTQSTTSGTVTKKRKASSRSEKDRKRVTLMCATLVSCFVVCWLPFHTVHLAKLSGIVRTNESFCISFHSAGSLMAYLNSALNPYLYSFLGTNFKRRWRLLKSSKGVGPFIDAARWKHSDSSASNRHQSSSKAQRNRNGSAVARRQQSTNKIQAPQTTNVRLSMMKTTVPQQEEYQMEQNNYNHSEMDFRENSKE